MLEVEIKARAGDRKALAASLEREGFTFKRNVIETDVYYNAADRDFAKTDEALRIRASEHEGKSEYFLTYKGKKQGGEAKIREEYETSIGDPNSMEALLRALGYSPAHTVKKRRDYYERGDISACVDDVEGLGGFVELEQLNGNEQTLLALKQRLGLGESVKESYLNMRLALNRQP